METLIKFSELKSPPSFEFLKLSHSFGPDTVFMDGEPFRSVLHALIYRAAKDYFDGGECEMGLSLRQTVLIRFKKSPTYLESLSLLKQHLPKGRTLSIILNAQLVRQLLWDKMLRHKDLQLKLFESTSKLTDFQYESEFDPKNYVG